MTATTWHAVAGTCPWRLVQFCVKHDLGHDHLLLDVERLSHVDERK